MRIWLSSWCLRLLAAAAQMARPMPSDCGDQSDQPPALVDFGDAAPVECLKTTAPAIPYSIRCTLKFYERCTITLDGGEGEQHTLSRARR